MENQKIFDYHVHERHSEDAAETSIKDVVKAAELRGLSEVAFTTHLVTGGPDIGFGIQPDEITEYLEEIYSAQEDTDVSLRTGLEVDYFPEEERHIEEVLDEYPFDFILGSVHRVNGLSVATREDSFRYFKGRPLSDSIDEYLQLWNRAIDSGLFDVMAHPDYFKKHLPEMGYASLKFEDFGSRIFDSFDKLASSGVGFEVNTSCMRHGAGSFFPVAEFVAQARLAGVKTVTVGSDSHKIETLGYHIPEALELLRNSGYDQVSIFGGRRSSSVDISNIKSKNLVEINLPSIQPVLI